ncbi:MAG: M48 family metalloprotease [Acaryochloridaceae cyanobacterium RL_2_7]|nr:M48 family metalloprotease [Acaryochloridaceae cyanobacterium RL_2_7]
MPHLLMFSLALGLAWLLRASWRWFPGRSIQDGIRSLILLVVPSLFVLMTAISIVVMGPWGNRMPYWQGLLSHLVATVFIIHASLSLGQLLHRNFKVMKFVHTLPIQQIDRSQFRLLESSELFIARCGVMQNELVISQGLLNACSSEQIEAMLAHERAHLLYQDVFWSAMIYWCKICCPFSLRKRAMEIRCVNARASG